MKIEIPLLIDLPPLSDKSAIEMHRFLEAVTTAFEDRYSSQIWRYYDKNPHLPRPARYTGEPF